MRKLPDAADTGVQPLPGMLSKKTLGPRARRTSQQAQRSPRDMRENPIGDASVKVCQPLFGESRLFPKNPFRMGEADAYAIRRDMDP